MKRQTIKYIVSLTGWLLFAGQVFAQSAPPANWQNLDLKADGVFGISMEKAYTELLKGKTAVPVVVAVIDGGVDINHEDLKSVIWTNPKEIPGNGKDDDGNGYIDDIHGWNFNGDAKGSFHYDNTDLVRQLRAELKKDPNSAAAKELQSEVDTKLKSFVDFIPRLEPQVTAYNHILKTIGKENPTIKDFKNYRYQTADEEAELVDMVSALKADPDFGDYKDWFEGRYPNTMAAIKYALNINYNPRADHSFERPGYGNPDVKGLDPSHGTHVAGIIAADRNNGTGIKGVADHVLIMPILAVPDPDFLDEDMANAIRYAADNGAKVINISINKASATNKPLIDSAVKYAMGKDVLIIHAAGNDGTESTDSNSPSRKYTDGGEAQAWIEVGASGWKDDDSLCAKFSDFGATSVDVFAPGVKINSTWTSNGYSVESGTSMAAPVVAGLAAVIREYYPKLTAVQVKEILMKSVVKADQLKDKCISGGIVNAYQALKLAATY